MALAEFDSDAMDALKALSTDTGELVPKYHLDMGYPPLNKMLTGSPFRGLTCGRIYEIAGPASSGKTLLATMAMIAAQEQGGIAIMEDWEQAFSADLAAQIGLCVEAPYFIYNRPETWEDGNSHAMKVAKMVRDKKMIPDDAPIVVVFDSIAAATAMSQLYDSKGVRREIDSMGMNDTTALARATSLTLKIINNQIGHYNVVAIYLNQIRTKPGVCYGDPTTTPGGGAMEYYASTRIFTGMKRTFDGTGSDKELTGTLIGMTTKKNKIAKPLQTTHLRLMYGDDALARFDWTGGYIDELVDSGQLAEKSGRVEWEGKTYFRSQLIKKIDEEGRLQDLKNMYLEPYKR